MTTRKARYVIEISTVLLSMPASAQLRPIEARARQVIPSRSACELARDARQRQSPSAAALEAKCRAAGTDTVAAPMAAPPRAPEPRQSLEPASAVRPTVNATVPDMLGTRIDHAEFELKKRGYAVTVRYVDAPDPGARWDTGDVVVAMSPAGGTPQIGGTVRLTHARGATLVGIGVLGGQDTARRDGFDIDRMQFAQITHGADIVVAEHEDRRIEGRDGASPHYAGHGTFLEASDGARLTDVSTSGFFGGSLGSATNFAVCTTALERAPRRVQLDVLNALPGDQSSVSVCVRTSDGSIAALVFRAEENLRPTSSRAPAGFERAVRSYKFHAAVFDRRELERQRAMKRVVSERRTIAQ